MIYQLGWATLPGLRGLSVSDFRATPTATPDMEKGVAVEFANEAARDDFLRQLEEYFAPRSLHQRGRRIRQRQGVRAGAGEQTNLGSCRPERSNALEQASKKLKLSS